MIYFFLLVFNVNFTISDIFVDTSLIPPIKLPDLDFKTTNIIPKYNYSSEERSTEKIFNQEIKIPESIKNNFPNLLDKIKIEASGWSSDPLPTFESLVNLPIKALPSPTLKIPLPPTIFENF
jgi:hypothetical protein